MANTSAVHCSNRSFSCFYIYCWESVTYDTTYESDLVILRVLLLALIQLHLRYIFGLSEYRASSLHCLTFSWYYHCVFSVQNWWVASLVYYMESNRKFELKLDWSEGIPRPCVGAVQCMVASRFSSLLHSGLWIFFYTIKLWRTDIPDLHTHLFCHKPCRSRIVMAPWSSNSHTSPCAKATKSGKTWDVYQGGTSPHWTWM